MSGDRIEVGSKWGRWTVVKYVAPAQRYGSYSRARVRVRCVCGHEQPVFVCDLQSEKTSGCRRAACRSRWSAATDLRKRVIEQLDETISDFLAERG